MKHYNISHLGLVRTAVAFLVFILVSMSATTGFAHVRWFVDADNAILPNYPIYALNDIEIIIWVVIGLVLIGASIFLDGKLPKVPIIPTKIRHDILESLRIFAGMSFLLTAYSGALIAPHMQAIGGLGTTLLFLQALIGIMLISNNFIHYAAGMLVALWLGVMVQFGFLFALEYSNVVGIALFFLFNYMPNKQLRERYKPYSVDVLRIFTGIALVTLGVTEKLYGSDLGQAFIAKYPWNFMQMLGVESFTNQLFVLSAGMMEVILGTILILGTTTRLNTLVISIFMLLSNTVFLLVNQNDNALLELVGHMPIIATAVIFLFLGYGRRLKITNLFK
ncbi:MAG: DoxX family membrane protein [Rhizobiales bacterium]|nr:DoxX family membrane protein [Hyphomicrobiales bacterium]NRB12757.1 DoxX family membrane protein [Hyphomicrobiales bacterium]